jgi:molybdopterin molybdotransferase
MISVTDAWQAMRRQAARLDPVRMPLAGALGRTLRVDARADTDSPPFDASAMDGYAARRADLSLPLRISREIQAGDPLAGPLGAGECARVFPGAPVPPGADCVVRQEDATREGSLIRVVRRDGPVFIRRRGENRRAGDLVVPAGTRLGPPELAALAAIGVVHPEVTRAPRGVHFVIGNELVAPDRTPSGAQIRDSNSTLIAALLADRGVELTAQIHLRDDLPAARAAVATLPEHDVLLISGGASVGDHDIARPLLETLGYTLHFQQVDLRPGKPLAFASRGARLAFALPGNPVSHWVVFQLFVGPLLDHLQTGAGAAPTILPGRLAPGAKLPPPDPRPTYWPCRAAARDGAPELTPLSLASSGDSGGLVGANALLSLPPNSLDPTAPVGFISCP